MQKSVLIAALLCFAGTCSAADENNGKIGHKFGIGAKIGTIGYGIDMSYSLSEKVNLRGGFSTFEYDKDVDDTDLSYEAQFKMNSANLMLDLHPFANGFRITGGVAYYLDNELTGLAIPGAGLTYTLNDVVYSVADLASLEVGFDFRSVSPYVGIGWGNAATYSGFGFAIDVGVINIGSSDIRMDYSCISPLLCAAIDADIQAEILQLEDDIKDFEWWPVLSVGFTYRF